MGGFFLRPKDTNLDKANKHLNAETILPSNEGYEDEYIGTTGFDPDTDGISGAFHRRDPKRREAEPGYQLPTGNAPKGHTGRGVRGWRGPVSRSVSSGFKGKGARRSK